MSNPIKIIKGEKYEVLSSGVHRKINPSPVVVEEQVESNTESMSILPSQKIESEKSIADKFKAVNDETKKALDKSTKSKGK